MYVNLNKIDPVQFFRPLFKVKVKGLETYALSSLNLGSKTNQG